MLTPTGGDIDPEAEGSVEARCARIRGRMMWILSQLEGEDALADGALLEVSPVICKSVRPLLTEWLEVHQARLDEAAIHAAVSDTEGDISAFAVAGHFATRNPDHERRVRDLLLELG